MEGGILGSIGWLLGELFYFCIFGGIQTISIGWDDDCNKCGSITMSVLCTAGTILTQIMAFIFGIEYTPMIMGSFLISYFCIEVICRYLFHQSSDSVRFLFSIYVVIVSISLAVVYTECDRFVILATVIYVGILSLFWYRNARKVYHVDDP